MDFLSVLLAHLFFLELRLNSYLVAVLILGVVAPRFRAARSAGVELLEAVHRFTAHNRNWCILGRRLDLNTEKKLS
jgi:hypothetical protein